MTCGVPGMAVQGDEWESTKDWSALELRTLPFTVQRSIPAKDSSTASPNNSNTTQRIFSIVSEKREKTIVALRDFTSLFMNDTADFFCEAKDQGCG